MYDLLICNGRIVDGRGNPWYKGNVAIAGGRIAAVGRRIDGEAAERLDVQGMYVCPGFIDTHTHSDFNYFIDAAQSKIRQGVTTEVTGNCGSSAAPWLGAGRRSQLTAGFTPTWTTMADYLAALDGQGLPLNLAPLVGHGTLRGATVGRDNRPGTPAELDEMERLLNESLEAGAFGMSTGLYFAPGQYAPREELVRMFEVVARYGGVMASHIRDESTYTVGFLTAVEEIIDLTEASGVAGHFAHMKAHGPEVWGSSTKVLEMIEAARARGVEITCDQYPFEASGGGLVPDTLPHSFQAGKSPEDISRELSKPEVRAELHDIVAGRIAKRGGPGRLFMSTYPVDAVLGKSIEQLSEEQGTDAANVVMELLAEGGGSRASWNCFSMSPEDVEAFMRYPGTMVGSDGSGLSAKGPLSGGNPHPRNFGTHPRVLGLYVRDKKVLRLEEAIRKMTSLPAQTYSVAGRGALQPGNWADLVVFDLDQVTYAEFDEPKTYPQGIPHVMVNGQWVIRDAEYTGGLPGKALRRGS